MSDSLAPSVHETDGTTNGTNGTNNTTPYPKPQGMQVYRGPSLSQPHRARQAMRDAHEGKIPPLIGFWCGLPSPPVAKLAAQLGFDTVAIDWEHCAIGVETMTQMVHDVQYFSEGKTMAFVRVPGHAHEYISWALDAGASGIIVPQVTTVAQARSIISATKFGARLPHTLNPLDGTRSAPPCRWWRGISDTPAYENEGLDLQQSFNRQAAVVIQIENEEGVQNLDGMLSEVGEWVDSVWLGSLDCRVSMGLQGMWGDEGEWVAVVEKYLATLKKHDKPSSGLALGTPEAKDFIGRGRSWLTVAADAYGIMGEVAHLVDAKTRFPARNFSVENKKG